MYTFSQLQESDSTKTNNGIQYRLQLLYANGKHYYTIKFRLKEIMFDRIGENLYPTATRNHRQISSVRKNRKRIT